MREAGGYVPINQGGKDQARGKPEVMDGEIYQSCPDICRSATPLDIVWTWCGNQQGRGCPG